LYIASELSISFFVAKSAVEAARDVVETERQSSTASMRQRSKPAATETKRVVVEIVDEEVHANTDCRRDAIWSVMLLKMMKEPVSP
jgi:uncharacterized protein (DUF1778 family)